MAERIHDFLGAPHALRTIPGFYAPRPGIQIGCSIAHDATDDHLQLLQQLGVDWAHINVNAAALHNVGRATVGRSRSSHTCSSRPRAAGCRIIVASTMALTIC